ncbi:MAG: 2-succinyl-6-hydroxy-2,4-cyclohexadiene-1-carboxylate synthase [Myxococcota bacterium]
MRRLLLLHGFTGAPSSWQALIPELGVFGEIVTPLLTGHGRPATALEVQSFEEEVDRLAELLAPGRWEVAGYSLGARLVLGLLVRHQERFSRAILISGRPGLESDAERLRRIEQDEALATSLERDALEAFVESWEQQPLFATQTRLPEAVRAAERSRRTSHEARGLAHSLRVTGLGHMPNYWNALEQLHLPVEVVAGALDPAFCALGEAVVGKLPNARFTRISEAGHNLLIEQPREVARIIARGTPS